MRPSLVSIAGSALLVALIALVALQVEGAAPPEDSRRPCERVGHPHVDDCLRCRYVGTPLPDVIDEHLVTIDRTLVARCAAEDDETP